MILNDYSVAIYLSCKAAVYYMHNTAALQVKLLCCYNHTYIRLEPNMLKNLPIIPSRTSQNFYLLLLFYSQAPPIIPFLFYCVNDIQWRS